MPDETAPDPERIDQLTDRIDRLESVSQAQQETIEELRDSSLLGTWGRRGVLGSIAAVLGLASAPGSAAAGVGDVGTPSERVDAFLDQADVNTLEANNSEIKPNEDSVTVGTTATDIYTDTENRSGAVIIVAGYEVGDTLTRFTDLIHFSRGGDPSVVNSINSGTPESRSYTRDGSSLDLAMASSDYEINISALGAALSV